ncbi:MAG TPA: hypothetical protein VF401_03195, partial [Candidatus Saccharimonadales bacterium]
YYSPYAGGKYNAAVTEDTFSPSALLNRQHYILDQMAKQHYITQQQADAAKKVDVLAQVHTQQPKYQGIKAPYFVLAAKQELENKFGAATVQRGGWKVTTTLDMNLQDHAEQLVASNLTNVSRRTAGLADDEANVTEDIHTGQIVEMVGGVDFNNPEYGALNFGASQLISPGSTFKPYDYVTLLNNNNNVGASSVMYDTQGALPAKGYECTNKAKPNAQGTGGNCLFDYDFIYPGPITLRYALGGSRNVPAVKAMLSAVPNDTSNGKTTSINKVISTASAMMANPYLQKSHQSAYNCYEQGTDINNAKKTDVTQCGPSAAIGDGAYLHLDDHVNGFATLARLGQAIPRTYILGVADANNKNVYKWTQPKPTQAVKADAAYIINDMASDPNASYLPPAYKFHRFNGWNFAVKTGTTNYGFDGLMASWSNKYATVSWVGNHTRNVDITAKTGTTMELLTEPLTRGMMEYAHTNVKADNWVQPPDIKTAPGFVQRAHVHYGDVEPGPANDLYPSWYVGGGNKDTSATLDKVSNKVATSCTPAAAKDTVSNANVASFNIDIFNGGKTNIGSSKSSTSSGASATDDVHNCSDTPPSVTLTAPPSCTSSGCTITATVTQGTHPLSDPQYAQFPGTVTFTLNGQTIHSEGVSNSPSTVSFNYSPPSSGSGTLTATVTDSVLYSGSDSTTLNYTATSATAFTNFSAVVSGSIVAFSWGGGSGNFTVTRNDNNSTVCSTSNTSCSYPKAALPVGTAVTLKDDNGDSPVTTTVH